MLSSTTFPAVRVVLMLMTGIIITEWFPLEHEESFYVFLSTLMLTVIGEILNVRSPKPHLTQLIILGYHISLLSFSTAHYLLLEKQIVSATYLHNLNSFYAIPLQIEAKVLQTYSKKSGNYTVLVETTLVLHREDTLTTNPVKITLYWPEDAIKPTISETINATIRLKEWTGLKNPYVFNYQTYLENQGIFYSGNIDHIHQRIDHTSNYSLLATKGSLVKRIESLFSETSIPIAKALLIGDKGSLSQDTKQDFKRSGLSHLMAVSGLHVVFVVSPLLLFIPITYRNQRYRHLLFFTIALVLFLYCGLTGNTPSVLRAAIMFGVYSFAKIYRWLHHGLNTLACSAIVLLLYNPYYLWDIGFQLSYLAVVAIILSNPLIQQLKPRLFHRSILSQIWDIAGMSTMIQLALTPLLLFHFGAISFTGLLLNVFAIPLTQGILSSSMLLLFVHYIGVPIGTLALLIDYAIRLLAYMAHLGASFSISHWIIPQMSWSMLILLFLSFLLLVNVNQPSVRWKLVSSLLFMMLLFQLHHLIRDQKGELLHVLFLDVGQGDATLVWNDVGNAWLIDTGLLSQEYNSGEAIVIPILERLGIQGLNKVILTHPHMDHMGGMLSLLSNMPIDTIYEAVSASPSLFVLSYRTQARLKGTPIHKLKAGDVLFLNEDSRAYVLAPVDPTADRDPNTNSIMFKLLVGNTSFLFTGDADAASEQRVLYRFPELLSSTVLKCAHHGSKTSTSQDFLKKVNPTLIVVSLGWKNKYKHPHPEVMHRIKQNGTMTVHFTSLEGALWLTSDGHTIRKQSY